MVIKRLSSKQSTQSKRPPQVKSSKAQITVKFHKIPMIRFEDQQLTSFSGLLIFQLLLTRINLKKRLKKCFSHLTVSPIFGRHLVVMLIVVHLLIGFRRLRDVDYYRDDPTKSGSSHAAPRRAHSHNECQPSCPKRFASFPQCVTESSVIELK